MIETDRVQLLTRQRATALEMGARQLPPWAT
jgi:hypothetical protein